MKERIRELLGTVETAGRAASADGQTEQTGPPQTDGGALTERAIAPADLDAAGIDADEQTLESLGALLDASSRGETDSKSVMETATEQASSGLSAAAYASAHELAARAAVERAFDEVAEGADPAAAREQALDGLSGVFVDLETGLDQYGQRTGSTEAAKAGVSVQDVIAAFPMSAILIGPDHSVLAYTTRLMGMADDHSEFLGEDCRETIAVATYSDRSRANTLADKVAEHPENAHEHYDIERTDEQNPLVDFPVYRDESVSVNTDGEETHIEFIAVPMFDEEGDLKAVFELIEDNSEDVLREQDMVELIEEVSSTLAAVGDGDLSARAEWEDENGLIDPGLAQLTDDVNEMAESFEGLITRVDEKRRELDSSVDQLTEAAQQIDERVDEQTSSLDEIADEVEGVSATMEEIAANASQVADAADRARGTASDGVDAGEDAREATAEVQQLTGELVGTVEELDNNMDQIGEVVEIIADIADQTNMLALNANIEAARADADGDGFAVVANEVKQLATETQEYADEIASRIETIQSEASETIEGVEQAHDRVERTETEIERVLSSLQEIADSVDDAARGISEVATANDDQAATVEEITATVEQVQNRAHKVADTTEQVVEAAENQERVAHDLSERVEELR